MQADAAGPRSPCQLLALRIDVAADEAASLQPRRARQDGPTPIEENPAELLASAELLLRRICVVGAPSRLYSQSRMTPPKLKLWPTCRHRHGWGSSCI
jgi:hypothetical protein